MCVYVFFCYLVSILWTLNPWNSNQYTSFCHGYMPSAWENNSIDGSGTCELVYRKQAFISVKRFSINRILATLFSVGIFPLNKTLEMYLDWDHFMEIFYCPKNSNESNSIRPAWCVSFIFFSSLLSNYLYRVRFFQSNNDSIQLCIMLQSFEPRTDSMAIHTPFNYTNQSVWCARVYTARRKITIIFVSRKIDVCVCGNLMLN